MKCMICEKPSDGYTLCTSCGVDVYIAMGNSDSRAIMEYIKKKDPEKFNQLIASASPTEAKENGR